jgi:hypothetical protein
MKIEAFISAIDSRIYLKMDKPWQYYSQVIRSSAANATIRSASHYESLSEFENVKYVKDSNRTQSCCIRKNGKIIVRLRKGEKQ